MGPEGVMERWKFRPKFKLGCALIKDRGVSDV